ncbi:MAG TPA: hypothetical protein VMT03_09685 [Polyangia bacterium]|nr:hypothetical protein [Polyangia bacterium]
MEGDCLRRSMTLALLLGAVMCVAPGCGSSRLSSPPDGGQVVCTAVGCQDQFSAILTVDATMVPAGTYTIDVTADGAETSCTFRFPPPDPSSGTSVDTACSSGLALVVSSAQACTTVQSQTVSSEQCQPIEGKFTETLTVNGTPSSIHVRQTVADTVVLDETVSPAYRVNQPNGPMCGPVCHQASAIWTVPSGLPVDMTEQACDPLGPAAITLGAVIGVGQDAAGAMYVDAANGIFVSSGGTLVRQHVIGTGQIGSDQFEYTFVAPGDGTAAARDLLVQADQGSAVSMALGPAESGKTRSDAGVIGLTLLPASSVTGLSIVNTPNTIQYVGDTANGYVLVATVPLNAPVGSTDGGVYDGGLSIFYGLPSGVAQRPITAFEESLSGNGTVTFLVDGTPTVLAFGNVPSPDAGPLGTFELMSLTPQGAAPIGITLESPTPTSAPAGLAFTCLP